MAERDRGCGVAAHDDRCSFAALEPIVRNRPSKGVDAIFRVVAFNARGGCDFDGLLERLRHPALAGASVLLLCELDWRLKRSAMREVAADLAAALSMSFAFGPEFGFPRGPGKLTSFFGNAILSAESLEQVRMVPFTPFFDWARHHPANQRRVRAVGGRAALLAAVNLGGISVKLGVAHLERLANPAQRDRQMADIMAALPPRDAALLGGDFNSATVDLGHPMALARLPLALLRDRRRFRRPQPHEPLFERLRRSGFTIEHANAPMVPTYTFSPLLPRFLRPKLDWIALRGLSPVPGSAAVVGSRQGWGRLSDHDFIVCDVRTPNQP